MKPKRYIFLWFVPLSLVLSLVSCEDVINVKLKDAAPKLVVEGRITNISDSVNVLLHMSTDYFNPEGILSVNDATVEITDSKGKSYTLLNNSNGTYSTTSIRVTPGITYNLNAVVSGVSYTASATMPDVVRIDTLVVDKNPNRPKENRINIYFKDPPGIANYYLIKIFRNGFLLTGNSPYTLLSDKYSDGKYGIITINSRRFDIPRFEVNDTLLVELINLDKMMYDYYQILSDITDTENFLSASTPTNPPNNLNNGALGYFTALSVSKKTVIVK